MGTFAIKLPDIGEGIAESEIAQWRIAEGELIAEDQPLVDMLTDKAAVELPSPVSGRVLRLHGAAGDMIAVGGLLAEIELEAEVVDVPTATAAKPATVPPSAPEPKPKAASAAAETVVINADPAASPSVRRRAKHLGVDLCQVRGNGPSGRILPDDLERHALQASPAGQVDASMTPVASAPIARKESSDDGGIEHVEQIKIIGVRRKIAEAMQRSMQRIPHFMYAEELDVTALESLRRQLNDAHGASRPKLTLLPFLMRALVVALPEFPQINATYDDDAQVLSRHSTAHIGIATQTPNGLMVPVVRHAQTLNLWQSATEIARVAEAARRGTASRSELSGSTITITSLGKLGGLVNTPIINAPEVAIIGVNKMVERPVVVQGAIAVRSMMNLSASFDHRIVDGWDAALFVQRLKALIEQPALLFIAE